MLSDVPVCVGNTAIVFSRIFHLLSFSVPLAASRALLALQPSTLGWINSKKFFLFNNLPLQSDVGSGTGDIGLDRDVSTW